MFGRSRQAPPASGTLAAEALQHIDGLFATALRLTRNRSDAEDLVQDTFVRAFNAIDSFRDDAAFRTWLFTILKRLVLDRRRADRRQGGAVELEEGHAVQAYDALDALVADETAQRVRAAGSRSRMH